MNLRRWGIIITGALLVGLAEVSLFTLLPSPWRDLRPVLSVAVLLVVLGHPRAGMVWAALGGVMLDVYAVGPASFSFARLMLTVALISLLSLSVLTNRSVYATAVLMTLGRVVDWCILRITSFVTDMMFQVHLSVDPLRELGITLLWDVLIVSLTFIFIASFTRRFLVTAPRGYQGYDDA